MRIGRSNVSDLQFRNCVSMKKSQRPLPAATARCAVCGKSFAAAEMRPWISVRPGVSALISQDVPDWGEGKFICRGDLAGYRRRYVENLLQDERGQLNALDLEVVEAIESGQILAKTPSYATDENASFGAKMADRVAGFGGSWTFILAFCAILLTWMAVNLGIWLSKPFDPYPFILLNLVLSSMAALQAPIIMMSQRRQGEKDRETAMEDYKTNLKAELEIRQLHEKLDHQLVRQWEKLVEMQQIQLEMLEETVSNKT